MKPTLHLPKYYIHYRTIDLSKNRLLAWGFNAASAVLFILFGLFFLWLSPILRTDLSSKTHLQINGIMIFGIVLGFVLVLAVHELLHGIFFWIFTGVKPKFGFRTSYIFAAAPNWHLPRNLYLIVGLAPFVLISALGISLIPVIPLIALVPLLVAITTNAAGAIGDLTLVGWLLTQPASLMIQDGGDAVVTYQKKRR